MMKFFKKLKEKANIKIDTSEHSREAYEVASQWQLMWWKFTKHKLAIIAGIVLGLLYFLAIFCEFFAPYTPLHRFPDHKDAPPTNIRFFDEAGNFSLRPFIYDVGLEVDPVTFRRVFTEDTESKHYIYFFVEGEPYEMWGIFETNIHFVGIESDEIPLLLLGGDFLGRDLFSRILYGSRISLSFGFVSVFFVLLFGTLLGGLAGYLGGTTDTVVQRIIDVLISIPTIPLWMALAAALPRDWPAVNIYMGMVFIMSLLAWTTLARIVRGKLLALREEDFTMAARLCGASHFRIIFKHLIPSFASFLIVNVTLAIPATILGETALSFLGLGLQPPTVSWGVLLRDAQRIETLAHQPWLLWPAFFVILTVLGFNFLGDGLRDAADPYK